MSPLHIITPSDLASRNDKKLCEAPVSNKNDNLVSLINPNIFINDVSRYPIISRCGICSGCSCFSFPSWSLRGVLLQYRQSCWSVVSLVQVVVVVVLGNHASYALSCHTGSTQYPYVVLVIFPYCLSPSASVSGRRSSVACHVVHGHYQIAMQLPHVLPIQ